MRIYLTHCSKEKSLEAKESGEELTPDRLYTNPGIQQFIERCQVTGVHWAILSDCYGVFLPDERHPYYEKAPASVTPEEENVIIQSFENRLSEYDEIWFYIRAETFHPFYERVLNNSRLAGRVKRFEDLNQIDHHS
jgi:hypothetical protein